MRILLIYMWTGSTNTRVYKPDHATSECELLHLCTCGVVGPRTHMHTHTRTHTRAGREQLPAAKRALVVPALAQDPHRRVPAARECECE
jgi:hypothetical protein